MELTQWHKDTAALLAASICPPADKTAPMRAFTVKIGQRGSPRLEFPCMARTSFDAVQQHDGLREDGERIEVESADEQEMLAIDHAFAAARYSGSLQEANDRRALASQIQAQTRAEWSAR